MTWLSLCEVLVLFFWWVFSLPAGGYLTPSYLAAFYRHLAQPGCDLSDNCLMI